MSRVDFCMPIRYEGKKTCLQGICEGIEDYFSLGGKAAYVIPGHIKTPEGALAVQIKHKNQDAVKQVLLRAVKVISYVLSIGLLPLGFLVAKAIFRATHKFHINAQIQNISAVEQIQNKDKAKKIVDLGTVAGLNANIQNISPVKQIQNNKPENIVDSDTVAGLMDQFTKAWNVDKKDFDFSAKPFDLERFTQLLLNHAERFKKNDVDMQKHFGFIEKVDLDPKENPRIYKRADLHGDLKSFIENLRSLQAEGMLDQNFKCKPGFHLAILGDYCDRGKYGTQVLELLMRLKEENPDQVHLIRGNHEYVATNQAFGGNDERLMALVDRKNIKGKEALESFYETMPLTTYFSLQGDKREYVQCTHGLFEPSMDPAPLLDQEKSSTYIPVPMERKLSERMRKIAEGDSDLAKKARLLNELAQNIFDNDVTAYNWADVTKGESRAGYLGGREYALNAKDIRTYLDLSSDLHKVVMLFRGHQHAFQHLMDAQDHVIATTLPVGMDCPAYKHFNQPDRAYIVEPAAKIAEWKKRAILREGGKNVTDVITKAYPLVSAEV